MGNNSEVESNIYCMTWKLWGDGVEPQKKCNSQDIIDESNWLYVASAVVAWEIPIQACTHNRKCVFTKLEMDLNHSGISHISG